MKVGETIANYFTKVHTIANQMTRNGEKLDDKRVMRKILGSLTPKFEYVVAAFKGQKTCLPSQ